MIEKYDKEKHEKDLREWCNKRALFFPKELPPRGLVYPNLAMEFFYLSDCGQLMVPHFFITNPDAPKETRRMAMEKIINILPEIGRELKVKWIWSSTSEEQSSFNDAWKNAGMHVWKCEAGEFRL